MNLLWLCWGAAMWALLGILRMYFDSTLADRRGAWAPTLARLLALMCACLVFYLSMKIAGGAP